jgi:hypothetical protein
MMDRQLCLHPYIKHLGRQSGRNYKYRSANYSLNSNARQEFTKNILIFVEQVESAVARTELDRSSPLVVAV